MELFHAHKQWATRPADERFTSLQGLYDACKAYAAAAREAENVDLKTLRVEVIDGDVQLIGKGNQPARLTHWSFGQLAARTGAPAGYLRTLPATLAAQNLNHGLAKRATDERPVNILCHTNGSLLVRALTSDRYERIWNWEIADRLLQLQARGWMPATPDIRVIDDRLPLYASDHDLFAFVMHADKVIAEPGNPAGLKRGLIAINSEVGASKLRILRFLYREMCGNHIIWGAKKVTELALRHTGDIRGRMAGWESTIRQYAESSVSEDEATIARAITHRFGATKDQVLDTVFGLKVPGLTRTAIAAGFDAVREEDGDPCSAWGLVQGITRYSQTIPYADDRTVIDIAAGKLLDAF